MSNLGRLVALLAAYALLMVTIGLLWRSPLLLTSICALATMAALWRWHSCADVCYFILPFLMGPLGELFAIERGAWRYAQADFAIPLWLPFGWGLAGILMRRISAACTTMVVRKKGSAIPQAPD